MTHQHAHKRRLLLIAALTAAAVTTVTGCTSEQPSTGMDHASPIQHVHGIVADPTGTGFLIGTHEGIYTASEQGELGPRVDGPTFDAMGLTVIDDTLLASGHPNRTTPPELGKPNLGIIRSTDRAQTWVPVAFTGEKDFHVLTTGPDGAVYGLSTDNGQLLKSADQGATWTQTGATILAFGVVVDATGRILAATPNGMQQSTDNGASFTTLAGAPPLAVLNVSPDHQKLIGVGSGGKIWVSTAGSSTWTQAGTVHGPAQAIAITNAGDLLIVDDSGITYLPRTE